MKCITEKLLCQTFYKSVSLVKQHTQKYWQIVHQSHFFGDLEDSMAHRIHFLFTLL